jgi:hypothetical protein
VAVALTELLTTSAWRCEVSAAQAFSFGGFRAFSRVFAVDLPIFSIETASGQPRRFPLANLSLLGVERA